MHVGPQHTAVDAVGEVQHMVVVIPVDTQKNEAEKVDQQIRDDWQQRGKLGSVRSLELEHHDRDQDRDHAIAESFESSSGH